MIACGLSITIDLNDLQSKRWVGLFYSNPGPRSSVSQAVSQVEHSGPLKWSENASAASS
jgi:hypothetical protein